MFFLLSPTDHQQHSLVPFSPPLLRAAAYASAGVASFHIHQLVKFLANLFSSSSDPFLLNQVQVLQCVREALDRQGAKGGHKPAVTAQENQFRWALNPNLLAGVQAKLCSGVIARWPVAASRGNHLHLLLADYPIPH